MRTINLDGRDATHRGASDFYDWVLSQMKAAFDAHESFELPWSGCKHEIVSTHIVWNEEDLVLMVGVSVGMDEGRDLVDDAIFSAGREDLCDDLTLVNSGLDYVTDSMVQSEVTEKTLMGFVGRPETWEEFLDRMTSFIDQVEEGAEGILDDGYKGPVNYMKELIGGMDEREGYDKEG